MKVVIVGATSAIAQETARCYAREGAELFLVARSEQKLEAVRRDLEARGTKRCATFALDMNEIEQHQAMLDAAAESLGHIDVLFVAYGTLGNQKASQRDVQETLRELHTNAISVIALLTIAANYFERQRGGTIAVITSVAGDRGRQSNYVYGTAKGALNVFLQGLRNRLARAHIHVVTLKVGMVDTPMTAGLKKGLLFAKAPAVGEGIHEAITTGKDVAYIPGFWKLVMGIIKAIPEPVFKRLKM